MVGKNIVCFVEKSLSERKCLGFGGFCGGFIQGAGSCPIYLVFVVDVGRKKERKYDHADTSVACWL
jgi:hypothetical protein